MIIESHAHYDDEAFDEDRHEILESLNREGIECVVNICASYDKINKTIDLMDKYPFVYGAIGVHPDSTKDLNEERFHQLCDQAKHSKCVAIGEIGLDYYWDNTDRGIQKKWFVRQIDLAKKSGLPIVIHSRDAAKDTYDIVRAERAEEVGGILHCYSYSIEQAKQYIDMGFYLGIGGVVTFTNGKKLKEVVEYAPLESLVLETDSPYLAPVPFRGKRNTSLNLPNIAREIARIKKVDYETVINTTYNNAKKVFFENKGGNV